MEKRNAIALVVVVALLVFFLYFIIRSGAIPDPTARYLNVKVTTGVDCELWHCWFAEKITVEHSPGFKYSFLKPMMWYCGFGRGEIPPIVATLTVENPDLSVDYYDKEERICEEQDVVFYWNVPLKKGYGTYKFTAKVCGNNFWNIQSCRSDSFTYNYAG